MNKFSAKFLLSAGVFIAGAGFAAALISGDANAQLTPMSLQFVAPQVDTTASVSNPRQGEIIFTTDTLTFHGYDGTAWIGLGGGSGDAIPAGSILPYGGTTAPTGFLIANGAAVSRTTYAALFTAIGTSFGSGDGSTTFNLPDLRGRFLRGVDGGTGRDPDAASRTAMASGGNSGSNVGSIQGHAFQTHTHIQNSHGHTAETWLQQAGSGTGKMLTPVNGSNGNGGGIEYIDDATATNQNASATGTHSQATSNESRPVNANVNYIIKI